MCKSSRPRWIVILSMISLVILSLACGSFAPRPGSIPTPLPTNTLRAPTPTPSRIPEVIEANPVVATASSPNPSAAATPEPTVTPTPEGDIRVGAPARIVARAGINIREAPARTAGRTGFFVSGALVVVTEGPAYADDFIWWKVDDQHGKEGWVAGGDGTDLWLTGDIGKARPVNRPVRLGDTVSVSVSPGKVLAIRFEPGKKGFVARRVQPATLLSIVDGPVMLDELRWWKVLREDGLTGWAAEGDKENRWLSPME